MAQRNFDGKRYLRARGGTLKRKAQATALSYRLTGYSARVTPNPALGWDVWVRKR